MAAMGSGLGAQKEPSAADVLRAVTGYLATYAPRVSGVTLDEQYMLLDVSGGRIQTTRRLSSDLVLLNLAGSVVALRDAYALDENALREHEPRIVALLSKPSLAAWDQAQAWANESVRHMHDEIIARLNDPAIVFQFVVPENQGRVNWKIDGKKKIAGVETVGLRFIEPKTKAADYIIKTRGKAPGTGRLWVDPVTGSVLRTELSMQSDSEFARIFVDYARDETLDLLLPAAMIDMYEVSEVVGTNISNMGAGSPGVARRSYDCRASYSKARLTPIELSVPR